jgi:hypothetical protein
MFLEKASVILPEGKNIFNPAKRVALFSVNRA